MRRRSWTGGSRCASASASASPSTTASWTATTPASWPSGSRRSSRIRRSPRARSVQLSDEKRERGNQRFFGRGAALGDLAAAVDGKPMIAEDEKKGAGGQAFGVVGHGRRDLRGDVAE